MKETEILSYIQNIYNEALLGVSDAIMHLQSPNLTSSDYNKYSVALVRAETTAKTCQQILNRINNK